MHVDSSCRICGSNVDYGVHILLNYKVTVDVWSSLCPEFFIYIQGLDDVVSWRIIIDFVIMRDKLVLFGNVVWNLWKNQNLACFEGSTFLPAALVKKISM